MKDPRKPPSSLLAKKSQGLLEKRVLEANRFFFLSPRAALDDFDTVPVIAATRTKLADGTGMTRANQTVTQPLNDALRFHQSKERMQPSFRVSTNPS